MASKRHVRRKQCGKKQRFTTRDTAKDAMYALIRKNKTGGGYLHIYPCCFCGGFHFGHAPGSSKRG